MTLAEFLELIFGFFNSPFFAGLATILTGGFAIYLYRRQKTEQRIQAARVLVQEIRDTEEKIRIISRQLDADPDDLSSWSAPNSWSKFAYLFARDFDQDEIRALNEFFANYEVIQEMVTRQRNFYWLTTIEERSKTVQQVLADLIAQGKPDAEIKQILDRYSGYPYKYAPQKVITVLQTQISSFERLSTTVLGEKLKKLAELGT